MTQEMIKQAIFSPCGKYRYLLTRIWDESLPFAMCVGLNPSTANAENDDPTIRNLIRLLRNNGYGGLYMANLFGLISPDPDALRCPDPVGENDLWLEKNKESCEDVIFCWGAFKQAVYRSQRIRMMFPEALCFGKNANGSPKHPLYLKADTKLQPF